MSWPLLSVITEITQQFLKLTSNEDHSHNRITLDCRSLKHFNKHVKEYSLKLVNLTACSVAVKQSSTWYWKEENNIANDSNELILKKKEEKRKTLPYLDICADVNIVL